MIKRFTLFLAGLIFLLVSACTTTPQPTTVQQTPGGAAATTAPNDSGYPAPGMPIYDPYPGSGEEVTGPTLYATSGPPPAPGTDTGVVIGKLMKSGQSAVNSLLFLAEVQKDDQGVERVAAYDRATSPSAYVDSEGNFVFANIPPGRYGIVLDIVSASYLMNDPSTGGELLLNVTAGETTDLGTLDYADLPTPPK